MDKDSSILIEEIRRGEITNWYEFEMKSSLFGVEIDSKMLNTMISDYHLNIYNLLYKTMMNESVMDEYFSDYSIISKLLEMNNKTAYDYSDSGYSEKKIESVEMLRKLDLRNPKYLLKYFLYDNTQPTNKNRDAYFLLFMDIIDRTKIRATKMNVFEEYLKRLEIAYKEKRMFEMMSL